MKKFDVGFLLIADPFLKDETFSRSVVLLTELENDMAMGFILNKLHNLELKDFISGVDHLFFPVYDGGPVQKDTLHFLHNRPDLIYNSIKIIDDIYWGGDFDVVISLIKDNLLTKFDIRFFLGYSGWEKNQLAQEFEENTWLLHKGKANFVFCDNVKELWKLVVIDMGDNFKQLANYPIDPQLN